MVARSLNLYLPRGALVSLLIGALAIAATVYGQEQGRIVHLETVSECCLGPYGEDIPNGRLILIGHDSTGRFEFFEFTVSSLNQRRGGSMYGLFLAPVQDPCEYDPDMPGSRRILFNTDHVGAWHLSVGGVRLPEDQTHLTVFVALEEDDDDLPPFDCAEDPDGDFIIMRGTIALN